MQQPTPRSTSSPSSGAVDFARLATIRFPLILLVVFYHNETGGAFIRQLSDEPVYAAIVDWIAYGLGGVRVPAFFMIAGYVFFRDVKPQIAWFRDKLNARARSVLIPLITWSLVVLGAFALVQNVPLMSGLFSGNSVWSQPVLMLSPLELLEAVFGKHPFVYQLWFLRDLFVLIVLTPLIFVLITRTNGWITVVSLIVWMLDWVNPLVTVDALFFFGLGCHLAIRRRSIFLADRVGIFAIVAWIVLQAAFDLPKLQSIAGIVSVLYASAWLVGRAKLLHRAARYSFLVFAAHEPLLTFTRKLYLKFLEPQAPVEWFIAYFAPVLLVTGLVIIVFEIGSRTMPRVMEVFTGGRS